LAEAYIGDPLLRAYEKIRGLAKRECLKALAHNVVSLRTHPLAVHRVTQDYLRPTDGLGVLHGLTPPAQAFLK
jgi:hypothetical protein